MLLVVLYFSPEFVPTVNFSNRSGELPGPKRLCHFSSVPILLPIWKVLHGCPWGNQLQREEVPLELTHEVSPSPRQKWTSPNKRTGQHRSRGQRPRPTLTGEKPPLEIRISLSSAKDRSYRYLLWLSPERWPCWDITRLERGI